LPEERNMAQAGIPLSDIYDGTENVTEGWKGR